MAYEVPLIAYPANSKFLYAVIYEDIDLSVSLLQTPVKIDDPVAEVEINNFHSKYSVMNEEVDFTSS